VLPLDAARAQTPTPSPSADAPAVTWRVSGGYESFAYRDLARSKPPVDGSPIVWRGNGPAVTLDYSRGVRPPAASIRIDGVHKWRLRVRHRSHRDLAPRRRRRVLPDRPVRLSPVFRQTLGVTGLHAAVGVRGVGGRRMLRRTFGGDVELAETDVTGTIAFVPTLRFARSERFAVEAEWTNGMTLAHGHQRHAADVTVDNPSWGGGWLTVVARARDIQLRPRLAAVFYAGRDGEGLLFNHHSHTATRVRVAFG
jgi:hypothetical protein